MQSNYVSLNCLGYVNDALKKKQHQPNMKLRHNKMLMVDLRLLGTFFV